MTNGAIQHGGQSPLAHGRLASSSRRATAPLSPAHERACMRQWFNVPVCLCAAARPRVRCMRGTIVGRKISTAELRTTYIHLLNARLFRALT